jgi:serine/threonine protein phosphatase PrpC
MGIIRSAPDCEIRLKSQKYSDVNYLEASVCGWQNSMEDYTGCVKLNEKLTLFYLIDGHGGPDIAEITAELIP